MVLNEVLVELNDVKCLSTVCKEISICLVRPF
jgi:hypothetical protein